MSASVVGLRVLFAVFRCQIEALAFEDEVFEA